jgi:hypothetical protein
MAPTPAPMAVFFSCCVMPAQAVSASEVMASRDVPAIRISGCAVYIDELLVFASEDLTVRCANPAKAGQAFSG